jgi:predicted permease
MTAGALMPLGSRFEPQRDGARWSSTFSDYAARLAALPGVEAAGGVSSLPLTGAVETAGFTIEGRPLRAGEQNPSADYAVVTPGYFAAMRVPLLAGRGFDARDGAATPRVIVVSAGFARRYWPGEPARAAVGRRILLGLAGSQPHEVVGIVGDVRQTALDEPTAPAMYFPVTQMPYPFLTFVVRTRPGVGAPEAALPWMRRELRAVDPSLALHDVRPLRAVVDASVARQRFAMVVVGVFAAAALALATLGLYGVIAYGVAQRTREIGVRVALGATPRGIAALVLRQGALWMLVGLAGGALGVVVVARLVQDLLFGVPPFDPLVLGGAAAALVACATVALLGPVRRATRADPATAMRTA